jgi:hypothetical protein
MQTLLLNVNTELNTKELLASIYSLKGINKVDIVDDNSDDWDNWTDEKETSYLRSIPGLMEVLDAELKDPNTEWFPIEEVIPGWERDV